MSDKKQDGRVHLLTAGTPNGHKISILLEELGVGYDVTSISFAEKQQKTDAFRAINPNGRIPAIEDVLADGSRVPVFESGAIMLYLCDRYDASRSLSYAAGESGYYEVLQWLFFMNAGVGPMQGQSNHFTRYAPEKIPYAIERYQLETKRLYGVLDARLSERDWLVGDRYTIADLANFSWVNMAFWAGVDIAEFPNLSRWADAIDARPATKKGLDVPTPFTLKQKFKDDPDSTIAHASTNSKWILQGQKEDAEKRTSKV